MGAGAEADPSTCCRWTQQAWGVWDAGSARAAGFAEGTGREAPPGRCFPPALSGLSRPWITPTGRHLHGADKVPAAKAQREEGLWRGGCSSTATGRRPWRLAAQIGLQPPTLTPCRGLRPPWCPGSRPGLGPDISMSMSAPAGCIRCPSSWGWGPREPVLAIIRPWVGTPQWQSGPDL